MLTQIFGLKRLIKAGKKPLLSTFYHVKYAIMASKMIPAMETKTPLLSKSIV
jgi:hypothetical protein